jgi:predicted O-methyltransferase YrrM
VDIRVGPALESLPKLKASGAGPFDLIFIDADKENNPHYLEWALKLSRRGTVIVVDNVARHGTSSRPKAPSPTLSARAGLEMTRRCLCDDGP